MLVETMHRSRRPRDHQLVVMENETNAVRKGADRARTRFSY